MTVRQPQQLSDRLRITIQVDHDTNETLRRLAAVQGRGVSAIVREILQDFEPGLREVAELGERFQQASAEQRQLIIAAVETADREIAAPLAAIMTRMQEGFNPPNLEVLKGGKDPRPVTTGVNRKSKAVRQGEIEK